MNKLRSLPMESISAVLRDPPGQSGAASSFRLGIGCEYSAASNGGTFSGIGDTGNASEGVRNPDDGQINQQAVYTTLTSVSSLLYFRVSL